MNCARCDDPAVWTVKFRPTCDDCLIAVLTAELGPQADGRPGSTMIPVGLAPATPKDAA